MTTAITDIHSHTPGPGRIVSVDLSTQAVPAVGGLFSAGYHPWRLGAVEEIPAAMERLRLALGKPGAVAVGEAGIDPAQSPLDVAGQLEWLEAQALVAEEMAKPLVLHVVKGWEDVVALHRRLRPRQPWIVHGFRGKPELARMLLAEGLYLSFGEKFNPAAAAVVPPERFLLETDCSTLTPAQIGELHGPERTAGAAALAARLFG